MSDLLRRVLSILLLLVSYSTYSQKLSDEYTKEQTHLESLTDAGSYDEAIQYTLTARPQNEEIESLHTMIRNWCYVKQRKIRPQIEQECLAEHQELSSNRDSLSIYLDARILEVLGHHYYQRNNLNSCLAYLDSTAQKYIQIEVHDRSIQNLKTIGAIYYLNDNRPIASRYYLEALSLFNQNQVDSIYYFQLLLELGNISLELNQFDKAKIYYNTISKAPYVGDYPDILADAYLSLGNVSQLLSFDDEAHSYYSQALDLYTTLNDSALIAKTLHNLGALLQDSLPSESKRLFQQSLYIKEKLKDESGIASTLYNIALLQYKEGDYNESYTTALRALNISRSTLHKSSLSDLLGLLGRIQAKRGNYRSAYTYHQEYIGIQDSLAQLSEQAAVLRVEEANEIEQQQKLLTSYQESKEESEARLRKSKVINYALAGASFLLIVVLVLLMSNFQQIQRTKNSLFRKNLEVTAAEALIKGQEEERQRLAHQLHDKVGNHITLLKNHIIASGSVDDHLMQIVKEMSTEVRNISQDLMPPVLERFGLADALEELCSRYRDQMDAMIDLNIDQSRMNLLNNDDQINLYRLVQEIIQISLFQYQANYVLIEMRWDDQGVWVSIEDNGTRKPRLTEDDLVYHSWKAIEHRVQFLKGELKRSNHNQGNEYSVFIPKVQS